MSLWLCYVALFDLRPLAKRFLKKTPSASDEVSPLSPWPLRIVGVVLVAGAVIQGARGQMSSYPFACYPTFQWMARSEMPDLVIAAIDAEGRSRELRHARSPSGYRTQREWGELWRLAGATGPVDENRLRAYFATVERRPENREALATAKSVRFFRDYRSVRPEERDRPPLRGTLLLELPLAASER